MTKLTDIRKVDELHIRSYYTYRENNKNYKRDSLEAVQRVLMQFFRTLKLRLLIKKNSLMDFRIHAGDYTRIEKLLTPFDIMILLRNVKKHYQYLNDNKKPFRFSRSSTEGISAFSLSMLPVAYGEGRSRKLKSMILILIKKQYGFLLRAARGLS